MPEKAQLGDPMVVRAPWSVSGSYYEVCNCDAICPCRQVGGMKGGKSTYGVSDFALSWHIKSGGTPDLDLSNLRTVLAGTYRDDDPGNLWHVILYVDERGTVDQQKALSDIFLGRAGGTPWRNYASEISEVYSLRAARIELSHVKNEEYIHIGNICFGAH